ncbi:MAG: hypothetical protein WC211_00580 [Dehalococcoidia bacterium]
MGAEIRFAITVEVTARCNANGAIEHASALDRFEVQAAIEKAYQADTIAARVKHATRSRMAENLVRVSTPSGGMEYLPILAIGKLHVRLGDAARPRKFSLKYGNEAARTGYWIPAIVREDLAEIVARGAK